MPLDAFTGEVVGLFEQQPRPEEICVQAVRPLRHAEAEGRFDPMLTMLNAHG